MSTARYHLGEYPVYQDTYGKSVRSSWAWTNWDKNRRQGIENPSSTLRTCIIGIIDLHMRQKCSTLLLKDPSNGYEASPGELIPWLLPAPSQCIVGDHCPTLLAWGAGAHSFPNPSWPGSDSRTQSVSNSPFSVIDQGVQDDTK